MFLTGLSMLCFSLPVAVYCYVFGSTDDTTGIIFAMASFVAMISVVMMIFGWMKRRNHSALDSIENSVKADFCPKCKVNVSTDNINCPICGNKLEKR